MGDQSTAASKVAMIVSPVSAILKAFIGSTLWGWFMVPLGVVEIGPAHAYGIVWLLALFNPATSAPPDSDSGTAHAILFSVAHSLVTPILCLVFGWLAHWMMT